MPSLTSLSYIALLRIAVAVAGALAVLLAITGCGGSPASSGAPGPATDYEATVQVLLPTAPATATLAPAVTASPAVVDTPPVPAESTQGPTYTPRPRPTYTPHPTPTPRSMTGEAGGREAAVPFSAYLLDGSQLALADTIGAPTLLAFWAPW